MVHIMATFVLRSVSFASARLALSYQWRKNGPISISTLSSKIRFRMISSSSSKVDAHTEDDGLATPMEMIEAALPSLCIAELKMIPARLYFSKKDYNLPENAFTLMNDGTIEVLEVRDDDDPQLCYEKGSFAKFVTMKIKGIEETVNLHYLMHDTNYDKLFDQYYVLEPKMEISISIGSCRFFFASESPLSEKYDAGSYEVLSQLHKALGIPEDKTKQMIYPLVYPYILRSYNAPKVLPLQC
ncbi:PREDICTED: uncharacterized protein LOC109590839 [Amphimedon queenslandica]|uniref:Uncharacterized protein n=1 Tax=Amphimedon queenslandica TaxID=400682 RepID=A0A1X7SY37_AMPQE|nr:PREDICTED: uncharacterized protein LOC109590839 [Amphimedon queenslandica]|eukprot:XP_019862268.1 PREDICTED: uncharacterized protein LOC109590839 [Amphimedon queenslandica]